MPPLTQNRLLALGPARLLARFEARSRWRERLGAKHPEVYEYGKTRHAWWFDTEARPPLEQLAKLSRAWPLLLFLLDYETEAARVKGLARFGGGKGEQWNIHY